MAIESGPVLNPNNKYRRVILPAAMAKVKAETGKSPARQAFEIWRLSRGTGKITSDDYYLHGLYRSTLTKAEKLAYLSLEGSTALNKRLVSRDDDRLDVLVNDKLMTQTILTSVGCPMPPILRIAALRQLPVACKAMTRIGEITDFLKSAELPIFGKPMAGSRGLGVMSVFERSEDGKIGVMGDGRQVRLDALAAEILQLYPEGYIFQPFIANHSELAEFNPRAAQTLRVVTLLGERGPNVLYMTWRIPGATALSDNNTTAGHQVTAGVNLATGQALRGRDHAIFSNLDGYDAHPETGVQIAGRKLPHFAAARDLACDMHKMFPGHKMLGWDVVLAQDGPVILECNANAIHFGYQLGNQRGFLNPQILEQLQPVLDRQNPGFIARLQRLGEQARSNR